MAGRSGAAASARGSVTAAAHIPRQLMHLRSTNGGAALALSQRRKLCKCDCSLSLHVSYCGVVHCAGCKDQKTVYPTRTRGGCAPLWSVGKPSPRASVDYIMYLWVNGRVLLQGCLASTLQ